MTGESVRMTCAELQAHLQDLLEGDLGQATLDRMNLHRLECAACDALVRDLLEIPVQAAKLPDLEPARDLWEGIESRIGAEVVEFPVAPMAEPGAVVESPAAFVAPVSPLAAAPLRRQLPAAWKSLLAASVLVAATAAITWTVSTRTAPQLATAADTGFALAMDGTRNVRLASGQTLDQTYDREIAALRKIVDERRPDLDSATVNALQKNIAIIDQAIAACKAALAQSPSSSFLIDRLTDAYDSKLRVLRAVAGIPQRG